MLTTQGVLFPTVGSSDSGEGEDLVEDDEEGFSGGEVREGCKGRKGRARKYGRKDPAPHSLACSTISLSREDCSHSQIMTGKMLAK